MSRERESSPFAALLWLRVKLLARQMTASRARLVLGIIVFLALAAPALSCAVLLALVLGNAEAGEREAVVHLVLAAAWCTWALAPLAGFRGNEFLDPSRLALFPVKRETVFAAGMIGSLLNPSVLFFGPSYFVAVAAGHRSPGELLAALALAFLLLFHAIATGQCLTLALLHTLRSRKFSDLAAALSPLVALGVYAAWRGLAGASQAAIEALIEAGRSPWLLAIPSGWVSHALPGAASMPPFVRAALALLALATLLVLVRIGSSLERRAFFSEIDIGGGGKAAGSAGGQRPPLLRRLLDATLPAEAAAVAAKDLTLFRREPAMRAQIVSLAGFLLLPVFFAVARPGIPGGRGGGGGAFAAMDDPLPFFSAMLALVASGFLTNLFGLEGGGITQLFLHPAPRRHILLGKAIAALLLFVPVNLTLIVAGSLLSTALRGRDIESILPSLGRHALFHVLFLVILASVGLFASILAPIRALPRGKRAVSQRPPERGGCVTALLRIVMLTAAAFVAAPIGALVFLPAWIEVPAAAAAALRVLAATVAVALLFVAARLAADLLAPREASIAALLTHAPE